MRYLKSKLTTRLFLLLAVATFAAQSARADEGSRAPELPTPLCQSIQVQAGNGFYSVPLSGGSFVYDPGTGVLLMSGMNNVGSLFSEPMQIVERHDDHFHVAYSGVRWDLIPE